MFANFKKHIAKKIILKEIEKQTSIHSYGFCPLSSVKTVLLLAESDEDEKCDLREKAYFLQRVVEKAQKLWYTKLGSLSGQNTKRGKYGQRWIQIGC
jgi:hypothetical protein